MRMSDLFGRTLRSSSGAPGSGQGWAERAGLARFHPEGAVWLPLGERARSRLRSSLVRIFPPAEWLWLPPGIETTGWAETVQAEVQSYRQLAIRLGAERVVGGDSLAVLGMGRTAMAAIQLAELCTDDLACVHAGEEWRRRLESWAETFGVQLRASEQGQDKIEVALDWKGPVRLLVCDTCGYAGIEEAARCARNPGVRETQAERRLVATPGAQTIELLASALNIERSQTLKAVFLTDDLGSLTFVVLPGDLEVSLWKLGNLTGRRGYRPATEEEIRAAGAEPGYASPIGLRVQGEDDPHGVRVVADSSILQGSNYAAGANQVGYHYTGVSFPRDFQATLTGDVALAPAGGACVQCGHGLQPGRGTAVASWRVLKAPIAFADERGEQLQARLGLGTIFLDSILLAIIQSAADDGGVAWPLELAPYTVHLIDLRSMATSLEVEAQLTGAGLDVLFDDRVMSAGVKFTDADMVGSPVRVTVGARSLAQGGVEVSGRGGANSKIVPIADLLGELERRLGPNYVKAI